MPDLRPQSSLRGWSAITTKQIQSGWRWPSWKLIWRHIFAMNGPMVMKFDNLMQSNMATAVTRLMSKPEVELQHGERLFSQTGSSYISAVGRDMSTKFGLQINFELLTFWGSTVTSTNTKPEVVLSRRDCHLENRYDVIILSRVARFGWNYQRGAEKMPIGVA